MGLLETLLSFQMGAALGLYLVVAVTLELVGHRVHDAVADAPVSEWVLERVGRPLARALAMSAFILAAYPTLFGWDAAPLLPALVDDSHHLRDLVNVAFVLTLLLPFVPVIGQVSGLILPVQGVALACLVLHWVGVSAGVNVAYWPGAGAFALALALALPAPFAARSLAARVGRWLDRRTEREGFASVLAEGLLLAFQAPAILAFTHTLGRQFA